MPYYFSNVIWQIQGHTGQKIANFDLNCEFPVCHSNSSLPMATKSCTMLEVALKVIKVICQISRLISRSYGTKIANFDPNWGFSVCNSNSNLPMASKWCIKLEVAWKRCPLAFQSHPSNSKVTRGEKRVIWVWTLRVDNSNSNSRMAVKWYT